MNLIRNVLAATAIAAMAASALAQDAKRPLDAAWKAALMDFEGVLNDEQHTTINSIAYHSATARLCDGIDLDVDKVSKLINELVTFGDDNLDDEIRMERMTNILVTLGTIKGLMLSEGALDHNKFCADAMAAKAEDGSGHLWK